MLPSEEKKFKEELRKIAKKYDLTLISSCLYCGRSSDDTVSIYKGQKIQEKSHFFSFVEDTKIHDN